MTQPGISIHFQKAIILLGAAALTASCTDDTTSPGTNSNDIIFPDSNVSYGQHVQPLFDRRCALSGCHDRGARMGDLSLESYSDATARPGVIVPGDPDASILVQGIRQWILEGAQNN